MLTKRLDPPTVWMLLVGLLATAMMGCGEPTTPAAPHGWRVDHPSGPNAYAVVAGDTAVLRGPNLESLSLRVESSPTNGLTQPVRPLDCL